MIERLAIRLKFCGRWYSGGTPPKDCEDFWDGDLPWVSTRDLSGATETSDTQLHITEEAAALHSRVAPAGSVLISTRGMSLAKRLPMAVIDRPMAFNQDLKAVVPTPGIRPDFLFHAIKARESEILAIVEDSAHGTKRLNTDRLRDIRIEIVEPAHQQAVAEYLRDEIGRIDSLRDKRTQLVALLRERRAAVLAHAAAGRLSDDGPRVPAVLPWLEDLPASWPVAKLSLVAELGTGHTPSRSNPDYWEDCALPWITTGEVAQIRDDRQEVLVATREMISELGLANSAAVLRPAGTVVLSRTASAGFSAIMGTDMATSQDFVTWTCSDKLLPRFLLLCLRAMRPDLLGRLAVGSTHKTIYFPDVQMLRIPLPSVEGQQAALDAADAQLAKIDPLVDALRRQIELLDERRGAVITDAITGHFEELGAAPELHASLA